MKLHINVYQYSNIIFQIKEDAQNNILQILYISFLSKLFDSFRPASHCVSIHQPLTHLHIRFYLQHLQQQMCQLDKKQSDINQAKYALKYPNYVCLFYIQCTDLSLQLRLHHGGILLSIMPRLSRGHSALRWTLETHVVGGGVHGGTWPTVHTPRPSRQLLHTDEPWRLSEKIIHIFRPSGHWIHTTVAIYADGKGFPGSCNYRKKNPYNQCRHDEQIYRFVDLQKAN